MPAATYPGKRKAASAERTEMVVRVNCSSRVRSRNKVNTQKLIINERSCPCCIPVLAEAGTSLLGVCVEPDPACRDVTIGGPTANL